MKHITKIKIISALVVAALIAISVKGVITREKTTIQTSTATEGHADSRNAGSPDRGTTKKDRGLDDTKGLSTGTATSQGNGSIALAESLTQTTAYADNATSNIIYYPGTFGAGPGDTRNVNRNPTIDYYDAETLQRGLLYDLKPYAEAFVQAQENYAIDAVFLAAVAAEESGYGRYRINTNNVFGYGRKAFASVPECIDYVASKLRDNYLNENGCYYKGCSVADVAVYYNNGSAYWINNVSAIMHEITARAERKDGKNE